MKYLTLILLTTLLAKQGLNQNRPIKTIFKSTQKDTATKRGSAKVYVLKKVTENSDFNYSRLDDIDSYKADTLNIRSIMPVFEPIQGQYKYYQFLSTFVGEAYNVPGPSLFKDFHDILIIKTDKANRILDAYQYTLEWSEIPLQYDIFKCSAKNVILSNKLDITKLKLKRTYNWSEDNDIMQEGGVIKLK